MINWAMMFCNAAVFVLKVFADESIREYVRNEIVSLPRLAPEQNTRSGVISLTPDEMITASRCIDLGRIDNINIYDPDIINQINRQFVKMMGGEDNIIFATNPIRDLVKSKVYDIGAVNVNNLCKIGFEVNQFANDPHVFFFSPNKKFYDSLIVDDYRLLLGNSLYIHPSKFTHEEMVMAMNNTFISLLGGRDNIVRAQREVDEIGIKYICELSRGLMSGAAAQFYDLGYYAEIEGKRIKLRPIKTKMQQFLESLVR